MQELRHLILWEHVTILRIPSWRPDLYTVVHILNPVQESSRLARVLEKLGATPVEAAARPGPVPADGEDGTAPPQLTAREREVLRWVAAGLQNKEIAQTLDLSLATVRNHIHNILEKLGVHSKLEAVSLAFRNGWVPRTTPPAEQTNGPLRGCLRGRGGRFITSGSGFSMPRASAGNISVPRSMARI